MLTIIFNSALPTILLLLINPHSAYTMESKNDTTTHNHTIKLIRFHALISSDIQEKIETFEQSSLSPRSLLVDKFATIQKEGPASPYMQQKLAKQATRDVMTLCTGKAFKEAYLASSPEQRTSIQLQAKSKQIDILKIYNEFIITIFS